MSIMPAPRLVNPKEDRPDRRMINTRIRYGICDACNAMYSSERMNVGMKHKFCAVSPAGRFRRSS
jgi:hypothetical protein